MPYSPPHPEQSQPKPQGHVEMEPGHHPGHDHPAHLAHHWDSSVQQFEAGKLGMWLFLATEVLLFGGLFCAYAVWRGNHPELFRYGSTFLDTSMGATNTVVLILSSLTMAWGVTAAQKNQRGLLILMLCLTLAGAAIFMVIKYFEYTHKFHEGWYPGVKFYERPAGHAATAPAAAPEQLPAQQPRVVQPDVQQQQPPTASGGDGGFELETLAVTPTEAAAQPTSEGWAFKAADSGPRGLAADPQLTAQPFEIEVARPESVIDPLDDPLRPPNTHMFFNIYFMMTGLHGIHVVVGMIVIGWLLFRSIRGDFSSEYFTPVDLGGLYWHIVDLIWIFLFPLFYLI